MQEGGGTVPCLASASTILTERLQTTFWCALEHDQQFKLLRWLHVTPRIMPMRLARIAALRVFEPEETEAGPG